MISATLARQLEELHLLKCSLLPGEVLAFIQDTESWVDMLETYPDVSSIREPSHWQACFEVKLGSSNIWFEAELPKNYPDGDLPLISVKGTDVTRDEQEKWTMNIKKRTQELEGNQYFIYELFSLHLLPLLHAELDSITTPKSTVTAPLLPALQYHTLMTSHHLVSPQKRRSLQHWSSTLATSGFAKIGYPGVIYAYGEQANVEKFVGNVKAMQWLALRVRFMEPINDREVDRTVAEKRWVEFQKVGEVVEEMRRIGREEYVLEMGIGSSGSLK